MTKPASDPAKPLAGLPKSAQTFLDIDGKTLEKALVLIRDKFRLATDATIFLEIKTRTSGINSGIANQRDATSHLATLLRMSGADPAALEAQLNHIEEHMRRAVMEPYEKTVQLLQERFLQQLSLYKEQVLSTPNVQEVLPKALTLSQIDAALDAVDQMCAEGRRAKLENSWSDAWERGVKHFIAAVTELENLHREIDGHLIRAAQVRREQELKAISDDHAAEQKQLANEQMEAIRRSAGEQIVEARAHAARGKRRAYFLLPLSAALGLLLKILWDWYTAGAPKPPTP